MHDNVSVDPTESIVRSRAVNSQKSYAPVAPGVLQHSRAGF